MDKSRLKLWYARSRDIIGTARDKENLVLLRQQYPDHEILASRKGECKRGEPRVLDKFFARIDKVDRVVVADTRGIVTAGVHAEALHALHRDIPVEALRRRGSRSISDLQVVKNPKRGGKWGRIII